MAIASPVRPGPLPRALLSASRARRTGVLHSPSEPARAVWLREGSPVYVDSAAPGEGMAEYLVTCGAISEIARVLVETEATRPGIREEHAVSESGVLGPAEVLERGRELFERRLFAAFAEGRADWGFEERELPPDLPLFPVSADVTLLRALAEHYPGGRLHVEFPVADGDRYVFSAAALAEHPTLSLAKDQVRLTGLLDGQRTFGEVVAAMRLDPQKVHATLYGLALVGLVEFMAQPAPPAGKQVTGSMVSARSPGRPDPGSLAGAGKGPEMEERARRELPAVLDVADETAPEAVRQAFKAVVTRYDLGRAHWLPEADRAAALALLERATDALLVLTQRDAREKYLATPPWDRDVTAAGITARLAPEKHYVKAGVYMTAGNHLAAEASLLPALQLAPRDARFHLRMGMCVYLRAKSRGEPRIPAGAARSLEKAAALDARADQAWLYLGHIAMAHGDRGRARECYGKALEINPSSDEARRSVMRAENA